MPQRIKINNKTGRDSFFIKFAFGFCDVAISPYIFYVWFLLCLRFKKPVELTQSISTKWMLLII